MQKGAGLGSAIPDNEYVAAGAKILDSAAELWQKSEMIVKVKEPLEEEYPKMREGQLIYTYFHFAADKALTDACLKRKITALAYETVNEDGALPLLKPMSEVAGRMASLMGAYYLAKTNGGRGLLPMGVTGVPPAEILILGGGNVGTNAARVAAGLGAQVTILDLNLKRLEYLGEIMPANVTPIYSDPVTLLHHLRTADIIIGAVLVPGSVAPKLIRKSHLKKMKPGAVMVDVAIDQGGCFETSHPTTHSDPVFIIDDIVHYCVANMPGAYARTSTYALNNATIIYGLQLAGKGVLQACKENAALKSGLNMYSGNITFKAVADAFHMQSKYKPVDKVLA
jgi:alanine dehydrogenase